MMDEHKFNKKTTKMQSVEDEPENERVVSEPTYLSKKYRRNLFVGIILLISVCQGWKVTHQSPTNIRSNLTQIIMKQSQGLMPSSEDHSKNNDNDDDNNNKRNNNNKNTTSQEYLLSIPFYIYEEFDWLSTSSSNSSNNNNNATTTIGNITFEEFAKKSLALGGKEDFEMLFYLSARKHPMRVLNPEDAQLFIIPIMSVYISWYAVYKDENISICHQNRCNVDLLNHANDVLGRSKWFQRYDGKDHIATFTSFFWHHSDVNPALMKYLNLRRCNAVLAESGLWTGKNQDVKPIDDDRISYNMMYVGNGCEPIIPFEHKTDDVTMVGNLGRRVKKTNAFFQDRRNICTWVNHSNFTLKHSMSVCGTGAQCPTLSNARLGYHVRGDSFSASRLFDTLLSGTVPIMTLDEHYHAHQSFIDWEKLSYFIPLGEDGVKNATSFLQKMDEILEDRNAIEEKTKVVLDNRDLFDWRTLIPFDSYMYMFQAHIYPETRVNHCKYNALKLPPPVVYT